MAEFMVADGKAGAAMTVDGDKVFIRGTWMGKTSKSKKGNMNMAWMNKAMFDELVAKYQSGDESVPEQDDQSF